MSEDFWPHVFTKVGNPTQVGEQEIYDHTKVPLMTQKMKCVHCGLEFLHNKDPYPGGKCPVRNTKRETKRILNKR